MTDNVAAQLPQTPMYIFHAKGANRITYTGATRISEAFAKEAHPVVGSVCVAVQVGDEELGEGEFIVALAITRGVAGIASGTVRATLAPILRLVTPIPLADFQASPVLLGEVPDSYYARALDLATSRRLIEYLQRVDTSVGPWLASVLGAPREFAENVQQSRVEARDAVQLAAQLADIELPPDVFASPPSERDDETLLETVINAGYEQDLEEELLPLDLQRFDGKLTGRQRAASLAVFEDPSGRKRLLVMSVNKKPIEEELGVDLLYWDQVHDAFTFVQYKRLEKVNLDEGVTQYEWGYRRRSEIVKQLALMPAGLERAKSAADWRAFETPFWFKFVRGDAGRKIDDRTLKGMHVPADWLRLALEDDTLKSGPRGGFRITYDNTKYLGRAAFAQLITRGFVGTTTGRSKAFKKVMKSAKDRELIVAVRTDWQKDEPEPEPEPVPPIGKGPTTFGDGETLQFSDLSF
ncbi:hypothetical protein [Agromyces mariniharenae]|uniref:Uncharacterized protein n=1 Tax=Agromyces mariniharenae TaxID=2604423 RepID=A0A5S4VGJ0_9MICO|nr:hypothetical protein [Agromyces mariniharenae]TYL53165.1 hypothetical protein FYC51_05550 [Agromyces mariniharenae]